MADHHEEQKTEVPEETPEQSLDSAASNHEEVDHQELPKEAEQEEVKEKAEGGLDQKVEELNEQASKFKDELQRERAEFINFRKRVVQEKADIENSIMGKILNSMLPALDSFDQLFSADQNQSEQKLENFLEGAELIKKQLVTVFEKYGVEEFDPKGQPFDPSSMEALHLKETDEVDSNTVSEVYQKGYKISGRLLRAARVAILKPTASKEPESPVSEEANIKEIN